MDTETVLQIIAMLDNAIDTKIDNGTFDDYEYAFHLGYIASLQRLSNHLNVFIKSQVNQAENALGE